MQKTSWIAPVAIAGIALLLIIAANSGGDDANDPEPAPTYCARSDAWLYAQQAVEGVLKNPDEADFHNPLGWSVEDDPLHQGQYIVDGEVTATNAFNAKIKSRFKATVRCDKGTWYLGKVMMDQ